MKLAVVRFVVALAAAPLAAQPRNLWPVPSSYEPTPKL